MAALPNFICNSWAAPLAGGGCGTVGRGGSVGAEVDVGGGTGVAVGRGWAVSVAATEVASRDSSVACMSGVKEGVTAAVKAAATAVPNWREIAVAVAAMFGVCVGIGVSVRTGVSVGKVVDVGEGVNVGAAATVTVEVGVSAVSNVLVAVAVAASGGGVKGAPPYIAASIVNLAIASWTSGVITSMEPVGPVFVVAPAGPQAARINSPATPDMNIRTICPKDVLAVQWGVYLLVMGCRSPSGKISQDAVERASCAIRGSYAPAD